MSGAFIQRTGGSSESESGDTATLSIADVAGAIIDDRPVTIADVKASAAGLLAWDDWDSDEDAIEPSEKQVRYNSQHSGLGTSSAAITAAIVAAAIPATGKAIEAAELATFANLKADSQQALIRYAVGVYRGDTAMVDEAARKLEVNAQELASALGDDENVFSIYNRSAREHTRSALDNTRVIVNPNLATLYTRANGVVIETYTPSAAPAAASIFDLAGSAATTNLVSILGSVIGDAVATKQRWQALQQRNTSLWETLDNEGESSNFDEEAAASIADAFSIGLLLDMRRSAATSPIQHLNTHDPLRFAGASPQSQHHYHFMATVPKLDTVPVEKITDIFRSVAGVIDSKKKLTALKSILATNPELHKKLASFKAGPFVFFAPTDNALAKLGPAVLPQLYDPRYIKISNAFLLRHVHQGSRFKESLIKDKERKPLKAMNGELLTVAREGNNLTVNERANVIETIQARNGTIIVIDGMFMPSSLVLGPDGLLMFKGASNSPILPPPSVPLQNQLIGCHESESDDDDYDEDDEDLDEDEKSIEKLMPKEQALAPALPPSTSTPAESVATPAVPVSQKVKSGFADDAEFSDEEKPVLPILQVKKTAAATPIAPSTKPQVSAILARFAQKK